MRTIADVDGEELLVGTTRNAILRGTFSDGFVAIVQVRCIKEKFFLFLMHHCCQLYNVHKLSHPRPGHIQLP